MDDRPTRSGTPWASAGAGGARAISAARTRMPIRQDMEPLYQTRSAMCRGGSPQPIVSAPAPASAAASRSSHGFPARTRSGIKHACFLLSGAEDPSSDAGTDTGVHTLHMVRAIGGAEGRKWEKSNEFNSSEPPFGANYLDLFRTGPLY